MGTATCPRLIPTSINKAYGKLRVTHSPTPTNVARGEGEEGYELVDIRRRDSFHKWKNHFYEMKGDVGMSLHEKERNKKMPTPRHKVTHNPIPTSLFCFNMLFVCLFVMNALGKANSTTS